MRQQSAAARLFIARRGGYGRPRSLPGVSEIHRVMADRVVPHFHNSQGVPVIRIGAREFMCIGALPPFDHPHIYIDVGDEDDAICSYCSTAYKIDPTLAPRQSEPPGCLYDPAA